MSKTIIFNIFILCIFLLFVYWLFRQSGMAINGEGMTTTDTSGNDMMTMDVSGNGGGIAGNASGFESKIQAKVIQSQDMLLISKYRTDYENVVLKMDDLVNNLMLQTVLNIDPKNPMPNLTRLNTLNGSKLALNNVMKFIDSSK